ncbi:hypothetical protein, partial [Staphylococcus haemolyticus]|uniref:hypothetical protein n=1 Tax=Staphylococcus haemolyticus TaxID=1283 RepID=UPI000B31A4E0
SEIVHTEDSFLLKLYYKFNFATEPLLVIKNENITTQRNLKNLNRVTNLKNCAKNQKIYVKNAQNKKEPKYRFFYLFN